MMTVVPPAAPLSQAWTADANEALRLSLVRARDDKASLSPREAYEGFHPTFTYPIFGQEEKIYGYRDLIIDFKFASGSLVQYLNIHYADRLPPSTAVDDIEGTFSKFIPDDYYKDESDFLARVEQDATSFTPPGDRIYAYSRPGRTLSRKGKHVAIPQVLVPEDEETVEFEVYHCTWDTPGFREYHRRVQIFILLYIEAGSYIREDEDGWEFVLLYEKRRRRSDPTTVTYHFVGYSTLYPFYCFPEKVRMRISQFVILPPYQQEGHGSSLYSAIYQYILRSPHTAELTVEDPAEAFEDLRDRNDLKMLLAHEQFMREALGERILGDITGHSAALSPVSSHGGSKRSVRGVGGGGGGEKSEANGSSHGVNGNGNGPYANGLARRRRDREAREQRGRMGPPADRAWVEKWRAELKIASRQFNRLIEMLQLKHLDAADAKANKGYRLQVKERLYRFNYEILAQLEQKERQAKLEETFRGVREDYERILGLVC